MIYGQVYGWYSIGMVYSSMGMYEDMWSCGYVQNKVYEYGKSSNNRI